jgi:hypothetical protein
VCKVDVRQDLAEQALAGPAQPAVSSAENTARA